MEVKRPSQVHRASIKSPMVGRDLRESSDEPGDPALVTRIPTGPELGAHVLRRPAPPRPGPARRPRPATARYLLRGAAGRLLGRVAVPVEDRHAVAVPRQVLGAPQSDP